MKNLFYALLFSFPVFVFSQSPSENYVKRTVYLAPSSGAITENDTLVTVQYFDGLGRLKQTVQVGAGGQGQDIVTPVVYDAFGRQPKDYLPYAAPTQHGNIHVDPIAELEAFYNVPQYGNTPNPYSEKVLEASPLGRVMEQGAPGSPWAANPLSDTDRTVKFSYHANAEQEVRLYRVQTVSERYGKHLTTFVPTLQPDGFYLRGKLYKTIIKDENWQPEDGNLHTSEEFKDFQGRVVLKRTYALVEDTVHPHDTYYVYDDYGNLTYIIPPKVDTEDGISEEELSELCYQYVYDHRNRLVEKKLPGKGWEYMVYNKGDHPVFTQDQQLSAKGYWTFSKYDIFGRIVYSGLYSRNIDREALQSEMESQSVLYESPTTEVQEIASTSMYYTNSVFPTTKLILHTILYYDTYRFTDQEAPDEVYGVVPTTRTKTLTTGSRTRVLGSNHWVNMVNYYDEKARLIYSETQNEESQITESQRHRLDFVGKVLETTTVHVKAGEEPVTSIEEFTYDRMGRLLEHTRQTNDQPQETLAAHSYDALGQLIQKSIGNTAESPLQTVDYSYNIRGWLTGINNVNALSNDLFAFNIRYHDPTSGTALYNGNISQTHWRTANTDSSLKHYTYAYDPLNRITEAIDNTGHYNLNNIRYDKNGNILSLQRQGHLNGEANVFGTMDDLTYSYDIGNKLLKVADSGNNTYGFKDDALNIADTDDDYTYDANGNMISDTNKGITNIRYNHLNLPTTIIFNNDPNQKISYVYTADGVKLQKIVNDHGSITTTDYAGDYLYENGTLKFINHAEGYLQPDGAGGFEYVYQYKDHLGNVRLSYSDTNGDGIVDVNEIIEEHNYYPFGLQHRGYNNIVNSTENSYKTFQGQEIHKDLNLNVLEFKYRFYDPAIGRFWSIDPLTDKYVYNSPYAFSENKLGMGIELEGLEVYPNDLLFLAIRKGQQLVDKFNGGAQRVANATNPVNTAARAVANPNFDPEKDRMNRITEVARGVNEMAEATSEVGHLTLDIIGTAEPTGLVDGVHSLWYATEGDYISAGLTAAGILPWIGDSFKAGKYLKYGDEVADLVQTTGKLDGAPKEIITVLKEGTLENGIKVADDAIGGLGDNAVEHIGKLGNQKGVVTGYKSANGSKGWRIDYDSKKGGHINWWNGKQKGAIPLNAGREQIDQILKNRTF